MQNLKAEYLYCVRIPGIGLAYKTFAENEKESIKSFLKIESRLTWEEALDAGYKVMRVVVVQLK